MKKRLQIVTSAVLVMLLLLSVLALGGCADRGLPELDPIKERLVYLIEESKELNVIYFGVGLPVYRRETPLADRLTVYYDEILTTYDRVREECDYRGSEELKEATAAVFSETYRRALYETAFDGVVTGNVSAYMRFYETDDRLYQNSSATVFSLEERIYDYSTMTVVAPSDSSYLNVEIECYSLADGARETVTLSFVYENNDWFLDSPTY